jgi:hypothetical protein
LLFPSLNVEGQGTVSQRKNERKTLERI